MSSIGSPASTTEIDLDTLVKSLPACKRCRDCRRGCDTLLPKCKQCTKAGVDCIFYDHGRNSLMQRSYIAQLVDVVRSLSTTPNTSPASSGSTLHDSASSLTSHSDTAENEAHPHYEHHFAYAGDTYRYLGAESCLVKSPRLQSPNITSYCSEDEDWNISWRQSAAKAYELVEVYLDTVHPLFPILDVSARFLAPTPPADMTDLELFTLNMVYSIACHLMPVTNRMTNPRHMYPPSGRLSYQSGNHIKYRDLAGIFFKKAMDCLEASTNEPSIDALRALLLLAINSLFDPKTGNIGQQVALAARLALDLEYRFDQELDPNAAVMLRNMHSTIFCIENEIASTLDRPATFPEPEWELRFDQEHPSEYLCSLYRLQHRFRRGDLTGREATKKLLPPLDSMGALMPGLRMVLHQTHLLLNPVWGSAWYVVEAVVASNSIHTFSTPLWVYRAATLLIQHMPSILPANLIQLYSNALVLLELSSSKWPSSSSLAGSLADLMKQMKSKYRPDWEGTVTHYDVRL